MRRIAILAALMLSFVLILAFANVAFAQTVAPHGGYNATTDFCISCHDVHEANGDYVLTRESTVTAVCGTCHGLFGASAPSSVNWSNAPADMYGTNPTASTKVAYKKGMAGMSAAQMDAVPGHSLGSMYGGANARTSDTIPGGSATLKVLTSGEYGEFSNFLYGGTSVTTFNGTKGLYCASCHTPHGDAGQTINYKMLSSRPNHGNGLAPGMGGETPVASGDELGFCIKCHDKRDNVGVEKNHPSTYCLTCHANETDALGNPTGQQDFPHTSDNLRILQKEPDGLCVLCHVPGMLP